MAVELVLGMIIALLINRAFRGRGIVRASVLVPWALTTVVSAKMWAWIYDGRYGVANDLLMRLHLIDAPIIFLVRPEVTIWAMIAAEIWKTTPFMALLLLAGLQLIPPSCTRPPRSTVRAAGRPSGASPCRSQADHPGRAAVPHDRRGAHVRSAARAHQRRARASRPRPWCSTPTTPSSRRLNFGYGSTLAVMTFLIVM